MKSMKIALIGMTGAGKTTVGKILAGKLGCRFLDTDELITATMKKTPAEIFAGDGEAAFRDIESETLERALTSDTIDTIDAGSGTVLSCGGGIVLREDNRRLLRQCAVVVWIMRPLADILRKSPEVLARPPINNDPENYAKHFKARESLYAQTCHFEIDSSDAEAAADEIICRLNRRRL